MSVVNLGKPTATLCLLTLTCGLLVAACRPAPTLNHFIVPAGYRGPFVVVSHPSFTSTGRWEGRDAYLHVVPETAVVCIGSEDMFAGGYLLSAAYYGGAPIYTYGEGLTPPPDASSVRMEPFGAWGSSTRGSTLQWFGVGDEREVSELRADYFANRIAMRMPAAVSIQLYDNASFEYMQPYCG